MPSYILRSRPRTVHTLWICADGYDAWGYPQWRYQLRCGDHTVVPQALLTGGRTSPTGEQSLDVAAGAALADLITGTTRTPRHAELDAWRAEHAEEVTALVLSHNPPGPHLTLTAFRAQETPWFPSDPGCHGAG